jgi:hypothetical protein
MDNTPSRNNEIPLYQLLRDFPDKAGEAGDTRTAPGPKPPEAGQPAQTMKDFSRPNTERNGHWSKTGKRKIGRRKR